RSLPTIRHEPRSADLDRAFEIDDAERRRGFPMWLDAARLAWRSPPANDDVVLLAALRHVRQRDVGHLQQNPLERVLDRRTLGVQAADLFTERATVGDEIGRVLAGLLATRDFLRAGVASG